MFSNNNFTHETAITLFIVGIGSGIICLSVSEILELLERIAEQTKPKSQPEVSKAEEQRGTTRLGEGAHAPRTTRLGVPIE